MKDIKVLIVSHYLNHGGAGRAAFRIFKALKSVEDETRVFPYLRVIRPENPALQGVTSGLKNLSKPERFEYWAKIQWRRIRSRLLFKPVLPTLISTAEVSSGLASEINNGDWDLVNLHWIGDATLSIEEIGAISKPVVWTLHDMWAFSGAEHYSIDSRSTDGYFKENRPPQERGPDINRETWLRKLEHWDGFAGAVAPSQWMADKAQESEIFRDSPVTVIPHPLNVEFWSRGQERAAVLQRQRNDLATRVGVGVDAGAKAWAKGLDLVPEILGHVAEITVNSAKHFELWTFGAAGRGLSANSLPVKHLGQLGDEELKETLSALDVLIAPSIVEAFGLLAAEAQACGTPVVCFENTGLASVVSHLETGYIAREGDLRDFAAGILWSAETAERKADLGHASLERANRLWSGETVATEYATQFRKWMS